MKEINFEIYTKHPETGETGWDIKFVSVIAEDRKQAREILGRWSLFDCIILHNYTIDAFYGAKPGEIYDTTDKKQITDLKLIKY